MEMYSKTSFEKLEAFKNSCHTRCTSLYLKVMAAAALAATHGLQKLPYVVYYVHSIKKRNKILSSATTVVPNVAPLIHA